MFRTVSLSIIRILAL